MKKTENGSYTLKNEHEQVELFGWVARKRNLGGLVFIDLRDRSGVIQLVVRPENPCYDLASSLKTESVIQVVGEIVERESKNLKIPTGEIEVAVATLTLLSAALDLPFELSENTTALEETRLKYRYLDLRRTQLQQNLILRNKVTLLTREYLASLGFIEVETPILCVPTPEGARDYLVPSRISKGCFYALPQSPQIFKQLLMIGGMEKYFQIARCFRDEDLRADRQPEFTQIDIEMSFAEEEDVWGVVEGLMKNIFQEIKQLDLTLFRRIPYVECMQRWGSDKPDLRFGMELQNVTSVFQKTEFEIFRHILEAKGEIDAVVAENSADRFSRKEIDQFTDLVKVYGAKALSYLKFQNRELTGSIAKVLSDTEKAEIISQLQLKDNDLVFLVADQKAIAQTALGALRLKLGHLLSLIDESRYEFLWVTDFPMFEYSEEEGRYVAAHHPFTSPKLEDVDKLFTDPEHCYSRAYDLVLNGYELLSGSIRIHDSELQEKVFEAIGMTKEEAKKKFGFFLDAFQYGTPPHGGVGIGLERLIMILAGTENIRDVVAFPKTTSATCLMSDAPTNVDEKQLKELAIEVKK